MKEYNEEHFKLQEMIDKQEEVIEIQEKMIKLLKQELENQETKTYRKEGSEMMCRWAAEEARDMIKEYAKLLKSLGKKEDLPQVDKWLNVFG